MWFIKFLLVRKSRKALEAFTKTQETLAKLNTGLSKSIAKNREYVQKLVNENNKLEGLVEKHERVIGNIDKFLND